MLTISILLTPLAFLEPFLVPQYWRPDSLINSRLSVEYVIFNFAVAGIMAVLYEVVAGKLRHSRLRESFKGEVEHALMLVVGLVAVFVVYLAFRVNFIYAIYAGCAVNVVIILLVRPDLLGKMVFSSVLFGMLYFVIIYLFVNVLYPNTGSLWNFSNLSGVIGKFPIEEIVWAFGAGAITGPMYEFLMSVRLLKNYSKG